MISTTNSAKELRCSRCQTKLAMVRDMERGIIEIKCKKSIGKGQGVCNTVNTIEFSNGFAKVLPHVSKNVI